MTWLRKVKEAVQEVVENKPSFESGKRPAEGDGWVSMNINGIPYKIESGFWVRDNEALCRMAEREQHRRDLVWALQSRVLTEKEMAEVAQCDYHLLVANCVSYNATEVRKQFGEMLLLQFKLRAVATSVKPTV